MIANLLIYCWVAPLALGLGRVALGRRRGETQETAAEAAGNWTVALVMVVTAILVLCCVLFVLGVEIR